MAKDKTSNDNWVMDSAKFIAFSFLTAGFLDILFWHSSFAEVLVSKVQPWFTAGMESLHIDDAFNYVAGLVPEFPSAEALPTRDVAAAAANDNGVTQKFAEAAAAANDNLVPMPSDDIVPEAGVGDLFGMMAPG